MKNLFRRQKINTFRKHKKRFSVKLLLLLILPLLFFQPSSALISSADDGSSDVMQEIQENVDDQLGSLDFGNLDSILKDLTQQQSEIFGSGSFIDKIKAIISGEFASDSSSLWQAILKLLFDNLLKYLPIISTVIAVAILGGMLQGFRPNSNGKSISNVIHFVTYGVIVVVLLGLVVHMVQMTSGVISNIKAQMDAIFPILLTLLTAVGGTVSVSIYQPTMALITGVILNLFNYILLPLFIFSTVFSVVSNLSSAVKLDKFTSFLNSTYKWLVGLIFTVFSAFMSIQGIAAGSVDGISIRTAKYAIKSYVPIVGSYISDGLGIILASSSLIKNAVGVAGLILMVATILSPLIELILFMLALKLIAGIIEPLGNSQIANFVSSLSKSMTLLISLIVAVAFMYFIMLGLVMCTAGLV